MDERTGSSSPSVSREQRSDTTSAVVLNSSPVGHVGEGGTLEAGTHVLCEKPPSA
jgi:hypothetical protein